MVAKPELKNRVLQRIASGEAFHFVGKDKCRIGERTVHVRYRSGPKSGGTVFSCNINPNTLTADYEIWICGDAETYYLFPIKLMKDIYDDPATYVDATHPKIRVAEVDTASHRVLFGRNAKSFDGSKYFRSTLRDFG